jgi:hypothetical protein
MEFLKMFLGKSVSGTHENYSREKACLLVIRIDIRLRCELALESEYIIFKNTLE